jgi:DMSO reductase anchor subunit
VAVGIVAIYCSAMIYVDTRRSWWRVARTVPQFFGTALVLGLSMRWPGAAVWVGVALFAWEAITVSRALRDSRHPDHRSAATIWKLQRPILMLGVAAACAFFVTASWPLAWAAALGWQVVGRYFYFTAVVAPRMPGAITT